jgi:D-alanyl-D-alanine carboxypeptidase/D-alanyl-D-alanine-endopeptidase (penicillin-binding protein 4)
MVGKPLEPLPTDAASVGAFARDLRSGARLVAHAPERPLPPASNAKLLTTAVALDRLGPDYRFRTRVHGVGDRKESRLDGDLVLEGRGTPDLSVADLRTLAEHVREAGVRTVAGDLVCDASWFGPREYGPGWCVDDPRHAYGAPSTALALARNRVDVTIADPDRTGEFEATVEPDSGVVDLAVDVEPTDGESDLSAESDPGAGIVEVSGTLVRGESETVSAPVGSPLVHFGSAFRMALADAGVTVAGETRPTRVSPAGERLATHESPPLSAVCRETNVPSDNFLAETLARTAAESRGEGTWDAWTDLVGEFLDDRSVAHHRIRDGSGLSRYNLVSARGLVEVIEWASDREWGESFLASLPEAGEEGTLADRLGDVDATVRAKTGTLTGTRALSGVIEDEGEPAVAFSVLLSNLVGELEEGARDAQDEFVRALCTR